MIVLYKGDINKNYYILKIYYLIALFNILDKFLEVIIIYRISYTIEIKGLFLKKYLSS